MRLWLLSLLVGFCAQAAEPTELEALKESVKELHQAYMKALEDGDADAFAALFHEDGMVLVAGGPIQMGHERIMRNKRDVFAQARVLNGVISTTHLEMSGDLAYEVGKFSYTVKVGQQDPRILEGKYVTIWKRGEDGRWRYQVDAGIPN